MVDLTRKSAKEKTIDEIAPQGEIQVSVPGAGALGRGTVNTKIRRYTNIDINTGTSITYADSATLGASFTINEDGVYAMSRVEYHTGANFQIAISVNANGTTNASSLSRTERLNYVVGENGFFTAVYATKRLSAGDVIRAHDEGVPTGASQVITFTIVQIAKT